MSDENDRKDENQHSGFFSDKFLVRKEAWLWALAAFVSATIPISLAPATTLGPIATVGMFIIYAVPASVIGLILGFFFGRPRLANRALLVILCLGLMTIMFILMN